MASAQPTTKLRPLVKAYVLAAAFALAWRALVLPWDAEGFFIQFLLTPFGVMTFISSKPPPTTRDSFQRAVYFTLFTLSCGLWSFQVYYPPLAAAPLVTGCFVLALVWGGDKTRSVKLVDTLSVALPVAALFAFGVYNALPVYGLRNIDAGSVRSAEFVPSSRVEPGASRLELTSREDLAEFVSVLKATTPYAPSYRYDPPDWLVTVTFDSGKKLQFELGERAGEGRDTCHIRFQGDSFQNHALCRLLRSRVSNSKQN